MKVDETNIAIIRHLRTGRKSFKKIADDLGITESTVRSRVGKLVEDGFLEITGMVDPECIPGHELALVGVKLSTMNLVKKGEEFSRLKGVVSVMVVTGRYDLIISILLNEEFKLLDFYTKEVDRIEGVQSVETFVVYKGFNLKVPYIL
jgi:Lrp/AsnC family transcriptional regulator for asnA, asnC and gidA